MTTHRPYEAVGLHSECKWKFIGTFRPYWDNRRGGWLAPHASLPSAPAWASETPEAAIEHTLKLNGYHPESVKTQEN